ncbi:MAG: sodium:solute symporter [Lachnospiraceae bacterium]|nr:sodium:solute symporter [Lachnospiraceae bacterium]
MTISGVIVVFILYFGLLISISRMTANRQSSNDTFFTGDRRSPWIIVAYGMIGTLLSGVTFMSVPGYVRESQFTYLGVVLGNFVGVFVIAFLLLPLYYRLNLTSIYSYLRERFGPGSEKSGAMLFIVSRLIGSALRMYLVVFILYEFFFKQAGLPFFVLTAILIGMILLYTFHGGIRTVVWTDVLQTTAMLLALAGTVWILIKGMGCPVSEVMNDAMSDGMMNIYDNDWKSSTFFWKQFASGVAGMIAMTGLDQDMMQKNLSCDNLKNSQKNMSLTAVLLLLMNTIFLILGVLLIYYAENNRIILPEKSDAIFSTIALSANSVSAVLFVVGLVAAGFSSADGSLTSLTTSFCINILDLEKKPELSEDRKTKIRKWVHVVFAFLFFAIIVIFKPFHTDSIISTIFKTAGFTYGPLLGMFCFGMIMKDRRVNDKAVPYIAVISPVASFLIDRYSETLLFGYRFGFEILLLNALLTFAGLLLFRPPVKNPS